jgi:hypothetical protein
MSQRGYSGGIFLPRWDTDAEDLKELRALT